jgi:hypothetical protein
MGISLSLLAQVSSPTFSFQNPSSQKHWGLFHFSLPKDLIGWYEDGSPRLNSLGWGRNGSSGIFYCLHKARLGRLSCNSPKITLEFWARAHYFIPDWYLSIFLFTTVAQMKAPLSLTMSMWDTVLSTLPRISLFFSFVMVWIWKFPPKAHVLKAWSPMQQCSEVRPWRGDWIVRALTLSMD